MKATLTRTYKIENTLGQLEVGNLVLFTLELPDKNNKVGASCIPTGTYKVVRHDSPKFGACFWIKDVPGRSEILIHPANFTRQLRGCISVGMDQKDIDNDGIIDNTRSKLAMSKLLDYDITEIEIR